MIQFSISLLILFPLYNYFSLFALHAIILYALSFIHRYRLKSNPFLESCVFLRSFLHKLLTEASDLWTLVRNAESQVHPKPTGSPPGGFVDVRV